MNFTTKNDLLAEDGMKKKTSMLKDMKTITAGNMVRCGEFAIATVDSRLWKRER
jgi:hypothetical protein